MSAMVSGRSVKLYLNVQNRSKKIYLRRSGPSPGICQQNTTASHIRMREKKRLRIFRIIYLFKIICPIEILGVCNNSYMSFIFF